MQIKRKIVAMSLAVLLAGGAITTASMIPQSGISIEAAAAETGTLYTVTAPDWLALRSKDSTSGSLLKQIPKGTVVSVTKYNSNKTWGYTSYDGKSGWICLQAYAKTYTATPVANGTYGIISALDTKKGLDVWGSSTVDRGNIALYTHNSTKKNQQFRIEKVSGQWFRIVNVNSNKALDVYGNFDKSGTNVQQWTILNGDNQLWRFIPAGNGYYYIQSKKGLYLDVDGGKTADGTNIQIWTFNGSKAQKFSFKKITSPATVAVSGVSLNKTSASVTAGSSITLTATVSPSNATNKSITWTSSNTGVATVSGGKVTAVKAGTATITAKSNNGKTATCKVTVTAKSAIPVTGVKLNKTTASIAEGGSVTLVSTVTPATATNKSITWTSSNTSVATVAAGKVTAKKAGTATITAKSNNGKTATCKVTVTAKSVSVAYVCTASDYLALRSDPSVNGKCLARIPPKTKFTVTKYNDKKTWGYTSYGGKKGWACLQAYAKVYVPVNSVSISGSTSVQVGKTIKLTATVSPSNASFKTVTWSTSDNKVATVSGGTVKGVKKGTATITAKADGKTKTYKITVTNSSSSNNSSSGTTSNKNSSQIESLIYQATIRRGNGGTESRTFFNRGNSSDAWCAMFVSLCANKAGIPTSVIPKASNCLNMKNTMLNKGGVKHGGSNKANYTPKRGDIIFWGTDTNLYHVGIVTGVSGDTVTFIAGNHGDENNKNHIVRIATRKKNASDVWGYVTPKYTK